MRDRNWVAITPRLSDFRSHPTADGQRMTFTVECLRDEIDFIWHGAVETSSDGTVVYEMQGMARSTFHRNRIGFCVLYPIRECSGQVCEVVRQTER